MGRIRIYDLAKELAVPNNELIQLLRDLGVPVKSHSSTIDEETANVVRELIRERGRAKPKPQVVLPRRPLPVTELAERLGQDIGDLIRILMSWGIIVVPHQPLELELVIRLVKELGYEFTFEKEEEEERQEGVGKEEEKEEEAEKEKELKPRPPIVTVMGHVDHGKTTLLDTIRKTNIAEREYGQITQHIGAYEVEWNGRKIVFIDTPGHEAFTALRARGATVTDIVVLVVAADDGVMPQTIEAVNHARAANVPIIVAINKIDRPDANPDRVKAQLAEVGLIPEDWGGETVYVNISALRGDGISDLLEMILLVADLMELRADDDAPAWGYILEAKMDAKRGPTATVIVKEGTIRTGDWVVAGTTFGRIRAMTNWKGEGVKEAPPSVPVSLLGLEDLPEAGDKLEVVGDGKTAKMIAEQRMEEKRARQRRPVRRMTLEDFFAQAKRVKELNLIVKADVQGSLEAVSYALSRLEHPEVQIQVIHEGIGDITESDVMLAAASEAVILGFNVRLDPSGRRALQHEQVQVRLYRVIYELIDDVKRAIIGVLEPLRREEVLGVAEVRATFKVARFGVVAGCFVQRGRLTLGAHCRVLRNGQVITTSRIISLRHYTEDRDEILEGMECGVALEGFVGFQVGDILEAFEVIEIRRTVEEIKERPAKELVTSR